eukprot:COSAG03_NODE_4204_length_1641_cov_1.439689_2_plen_92_part_00
MFLGGVLMVVVQIIAAYVMEPDTAMEVTSLGERGRAAMPLAADGPEMTACREMLTKALEANAKASRTTAAPMAGDRAALGDVRLEDAPLLQ